jgi:hypothetical protein
MLMARSAVTGLRNRSRASLKRCHSRMTWVGVRGLCDRTDSRGGQVHVVGVSRVVLAHEGVLGMFEVGGLVECG